MDRWIVEHDGVNLWLSHLDSTTSYRLDSPLHVDTILTIIHDYNVKAHS